VTGVRVVVVKLMRVPNPLTEAQPEKVELSKTNWPVERVEGRDWILSPGVLRLNSDRE
jgi:hypothetical protein